MRRNRTSREERSCSLGWRPFFLLMYSCASSIHSCSSANKRFHNNNPSIRCATGPPSIELPKPQMIVLDTEVYEDKPTGASPKVGSTGINTRVCLFLSGQSETASCAVYRDGPDGVAIAIRSTYYQTRPNWCVTTLCRGLPLLIEFPNMTTTTRAYCRLSFTRLSRFFSIVRRLAR